MPDCFSHFFFQQPPNLVDGASVGDVCVVLVLLRDGSSLFVLF
jgi:hypothetical protein